MKETTSRDNARVMLDLGTLAAAILAAAVQDAPRGICCIHQELLGTHLGRSSAASQGTSSPDLSFGHCVALSSCVQR